MNTLEKELKKIVKFYYKDLMSLREIATVYKTHGNKIRRLLIKHGYELRGKSEAQKNALELGKIDHPTKDKPRSESTKQKIAETLHNTWENMSDEEKEKRSQTGKDNWENLTGDQKTLLREKSAEAIRKAAVEGSKMEKYLQEVLKKAGYNTILHKKGMLTNIKLEVDLFIPELSTVIEVDGPSHFAPIWGQEQLEKTMKADVEKTGLLLTQGYCIVRVKDIRPTKSKIYFKEMGELVTKEIDKIKKKFPPKSRRFIELELWND